MNSINYGYGRVSTVGQCYEQQNEELKKAGCVEIHLEKISGKKEKLPLRDALMRKLRKGDFVTVPDISRMGRNQIDVLNIVNDLHNKGAHICDLRLGIKSNTPTGKLMVSIMTMIAECELDRKKENQQAYYNNRKAQGLPMHGRPSLKKNVTDDILYLLKEGHSYSYVAEKLNVSKTSVYRTVKKNGFNMIND